MKSYETIHFDPPVPQVSLVHVHITASEELATKARDNVLRKSGVKCFSKLRPFMLKFNNSTPSSSSSLPLSSYFELNIGSENVLIDDNIWVEAWRNFAIELQNLQSS